MNRQILLSTPTDSTIARATDVAAPNSTAPSRTCSSAQMLEFTRADLSHADLDRLRRIYQPLTQSVRELIDATIRTEVDAATARLRSTQLPGPFGVRYTHEGNGMAWGNPVIGTRNPIAPPLVLNYDESGKVWTDFHLGAAYEGPPGNVHGGVCAMVLDHVLGEA